MPTSAVILRSTSLHTKPLDHALASDTRPFGVAQFAGVPHHSGSYDPVIEETVASHGCRLHAAHACGDHHIVVGEVESLEA